MISYARCSCSLRSRVSADCWRASDGGGLASLVVAAGNSFRGLGSVSWTESRWPSDMAGAEASDFPVIDEAIPPNHSATTDIGSCCTLSMVSSCKRRHQLATPHSAHVPIPSASKCLQAFAGAEHLQVFAGAENKNTNTRPCSLRAVGWLASRPGPADQDTRPLLCLRCPRRQLCGDADTKRAGCTAVPE